MIPNRENYFCFGTDLKAQADSCLINDTIKDIWHGCCAHQGNISFIPDLECCFKAGVSGHMPVPENSEYIISVSKDGIFINAANKKALARAMMVLMMRIEVLTADDDKACFGIAACKLTSSYIVGTRMIHLCVFPETSYSFIKKSIRLAGMMQYTHVVLEFWGMLRFDCLKELSWPIAFSKEEASALVREITQMGMGAIPMYNHLGHASACRVSGGKHVVLDQNPKLASLFTPDGWSWNIENQKAKALLAAVRKELYEIFPDAEYFHLGCDEVYSYENGEKNQRLMREYLSKLIEEVHSEGKRPIIWGDMLLNREMLGLGPEYFCGCDTPEHAEKLMEMIPRYVLVADWHYDNTDVPVKSSVFLKSRGFDVLGTPWFKPENCAAHVETVTENKLAGLMVTTWHTLSQNMPQIVYDAIMCGAYHSPWAGMSHTQLDTETAALLRKLQFVNGDYTEAGWTDVQVFKQARATV